MPVGKHDAADTLLTAGDDRSALDATATIPQSRWRGVERFHVQRGFADGLPGSLASRG